MSLTALIARWRAQAAAYEADGQPGAALLRRVAAELEEWERQHALEKLTVSQAAEESGYSPSAIRRRFKGKTIHRADLPVKGRRMGPERVAEGPDLVGELLARRAAE